MKSFLSLLALLVTLSSVHIASLSPTSQGWDPTTNVPDQILLNDFPSVSSSSNSLQVENIKITRQEAFKLPNRDWRRRRLLSEETLTCDEANRLRTVPWADIVTLPPDVCGLCPMSGPEGGLYPCTCVNNGGSMGGTISIDCPPEVSSQEILRDIIQRTNFLTTNVSRFSLTESNITGVLDLKMLVPLTVRVLILDNDLFQDVDNHAFNSSEHTLTTISLANNLIAYFHFDSVAAIPLLKSLDLSGNLLEFIPTQAFMHPLMQILDLSQNNIYTLSYEAFLGLASVEIIDLSDNNLSDLQQNTFKITSHDVNKVLEIHLSNNYLRYLSPDAFADLNNLQVNLSNNQLTTLDSNVFRAPIENSGYFAQFIVEGNPIRCDCGIYWIIESTLLTNCFDNFHCQDINATLYQLNPDDYVACSASSSQAGDYLIGKGLARLASSNSIEKPFAVEGHQPSVAGEGHQPSVAVEGHQPSVVYEGHQPSVVTKPERSSVISFSQERRLARRGGGNYPGNYVENRDFGGAYDDRGRGGVRRTRHWNDHLRGYLERMW